jgi:hypothetical protein
MAVLDAQKPNHGLRGRSSALLFDSLRAAIRAIVASNAILTRRANEQVLFDYLEGTFVGYPIERIWTCPRFETTG